MKRKIISLLLCLVMALSLIPTVAFGATADTVDHIDVLLAFKIPGSDDPITFTSEEAKAIVITGKENGGTPIIYTPTKYGHSTDSQNRSQVRLEGIFPVGTKSNPVVYTLTLTKTVNGTTYMT